MKLANKTAYPEMDNYQLTLQFYHTLSSSPRAFANMLKAPIERANGDERVLLQELQNKAAQITINGKMADLVKALKKVFAHLKSRKENQKALIFVDSLISLEVLADVLAKDFMLTQKLDEFRNDKNIQILLTNDEPASVLLEKIKAEKAELVKQGKIKKDKVESYIYKTPDNRHYDDDKKHYTVYEKIGSTIKDITAEIPFDIPDVWEWVRLGNIVNYGETKSVTYLECNPHTWILDLEDIEKDTSNILCKKRIENKPFKSTKRTFLCDDVLYSKLRPYLNKVLVADENGVCTSEIIPLQIYYGIIPEYLKECLKSHYFYGYVNQLTYGVKMPRLGTEDGKRGLIPLPPLEEQERIIRKIKQIIDYIKKL